MKKYIFFLLAFMPLLLEAQQTAPGSGATEYLWVDVGTAGFSPGAVQYFCMKMDPADVPYVAFIDSYYDDKVAVWTFNGEFWDYVGNITVSPGGAYYCSLAISKTGELFVAFQDRSQSYKASVMKFNGVTWDYLGNPGFSAGEAQNVSLGVSSAGVPYVAYTDAANSHKATVMKYSGSQWDPVGVPGFTPGEAGPLKLVIDQSDIPYLAYRDGSLSNKATVKKFVNNTWSNVGQSGFTGANTSDFDLAIAPDGHPWFAYADPVLAHKATVLRFDGDLWQPEGSAGFTLMDITAVDLEFSPFGEPHLAIDEWIPIYMGYRGSVMKFDGAGWNYLGNHNFTVNRMFYPNLAFTSTGQPYVGYSDYYINNEAVVKKCDSVSVGVPKPSAPAVRLYPNPATGPVTLDLGSAFAPGASYEFTDSRGIVVEQGQTTRQQTTIDLSGHPCGIYTCRVVSASFTWVGKVVKR